MSHSVEVLIAGVNQNPELLMEQMNIESDAILVNQCDKYEISMLEHRGRTVRVFHMAERGVGLSRNTALMRAKGEICLFSDQDIVYESGYEQAIRKEFESHPEADMILFNIEVAEARQTYHNEAWKKVHWYNCGRYGAVSFAIRREKMLESGVTFSLLFGGGAKYSAGEDSLFLKQFMDKGYQVYASPVTIGKESAGDSTWFKGYTEKFFFDRGVLYHYLYGSLAKSWALRFLLAHKKALCGDLSVKQAYEQMRKGIQSVKGTK
ncbi:MAG: glycosyltransferase family 2 protein [Lachnospiraceae bacterium]|nr:glycosyltransferase family 2 protein [Lachnospiraceae bacterium]